MQVDLCCAPQFLAHKLPSSTRSMSTVQLSIKLCARQNDAMPLLKIGKHFENYLKEMIKLLETFLIIVLSLQRTFAHHEHNHELRFRQVKKPNQKESDY